MANLDEFQPSGFGVEYDLEAFEKQQKAEQERLDYLNREKAQLARAAHYNAERRKELTADNIRTALWVALIAGIIAAVVFGCVKWYQHDYNQSAKVWRAWITQCENAGGVAVGHRFDLQCAFSNAELPYGRGGQYEKWDKQYGPVWIDNCARAGGRAAGIQEDSICVFPTKAQLPYGQFGYMDD